MKLKKSYFILLFLFIASNAINAQLVDSKLEELADEVTDNFTYYLGSSYYKKDKIKQIYYNYYRDMSNLELGKSYLQKLTIIEHTKETELKKVLEDKQYQVYLELKEIKKKGNRDYYEDILQTIPKEDALVEELVAFYSSTVFPVLSNIKLDFEQNLSKADKEIFEKSSQTFGHNLDSLLTNKIELNASSLSCLQESTNSIKAILEKYDTDYNKAIDQITQANKYWQKETTQILLSYNYSEEEIKALRNPQSILARYGIKNAIDQLKFSQIDPFNESKYLVDLTKFQSFTKELILFLDKAK